jgi:hypothetical protein
MKKVNWKVIDVYSRKEAIADGVQVLANPGTTKEAGIRFPVYLTRKVYDRYVKDPEGATFQDEDGRLWDIFTMFKYYVNRDASEFEFNVMVYISRKTEWLSNEKRTHEPEHRLVTLYAQVGATDFDDPRPAITISIPGED